MFEFIGSKTVISRMKVKNRTFIAAIICVSISFCLSVNGFTLLSSGFTGAALAFILTSIPL